MAAGSGTNRYVEDRPALDLTWDPLDDLRRRIGLDQLDVVRDVTGGRSFLLRKGDYAARVDEGFDADLLVAKLKRVGGEVVRAWDGTPRLRFTRASQPVPFQGARVRRQSDARLWAARGSAPGSLTQPTGASYG